MVENGICENWKEYYVGFGVFMAVVMVPDYAASYPRK
jgi:hypothetical protein